MSTSFQIETKSRPLGTPADLKKLRKVAACLCVGLLTTACDDSEPLGASDSALFDDDFLLLQGDSNDLGAERSTSELEGPQGAAMRYYDEWQGFRSTSYPPMIDPNVAAHYAQREFVDVDGDGLDELVGFHRITDAFYVGVFSYTQWSQQWNVDWAGFNTPNSYTVHVNDGGRAFMSTDPIAKRHAVVSDSGTVKICEFVGPDWSCPTSFSAASTSFPWVFTHLDDAERGDFDGDGYEELLAAERTGDVMVLMGDDIPTAQWSSGTDHTLARAWDRNRLVADFDGDGRDDIFIFDSSGSEVWNIDPTTGGLRQVFAGNGISSVFNVYAGNFDHADAGAELIFAITGSAGAQTYSFKWSGSTNSMSPVFFDYRNDTSLPKTLDFNSQWDLSWNTVFEFTPVQVANPGDTRQDWCFAERGAASSQDFAFFRTAYE